LLQKSGNNGDMGRPPTTKPAKTVAERVASHRARQLEAVEQSAGYGAAFAKVLKIVERLSQPQLHLLIQRLREIYRQRQK
jgi:hypothetical protein